MNIALDYDQTFTLDPGFWHDFIRLSRKAGHTVRIVTMRRADTERIPTEHADLVGDVVYTNRRAKAEFCLLRGVDIDVWIDDSPHWILQDG